VGLLAAWQTLLHYASRQDDILVGTPAANREQPELVGIVGFFVNTVVMRTRFTGDLTFSDVLARVRQTAIGAYRNQAVPFDRLRTDSSAPPFRVWFMLQAASTRTWDLPDLEMSRCDVLSLLAVHDLKLAIEEDAKGLACGLDYRTHLFEPAAIARLAALYQHLLRHVIDEPDAPLARVLHVLAEREAELVRADDQRRKEQLGQHLGTVRRRATDISAGES
jgi:non-ribosomal peptide synthetase component F